MGLRCEICDCMLPMFQFSHLCPTCYRIRTIVKVYNAEDIVKCLENNFMVSHAREIEEKAKDSNYFKQEEIRLNQELMESLNKLETIQSNNNQVPLKDTQNDVAEEDQPVKAPSLEMETIKEEYQSKSEPTSPTCYNTRSKTLK